MCVCEALNLFIYLLPPVSEGWGKVIFSVCVSFHTSGGGALGYHHPADGGGAVPPSQVQVGGRTGKVCPPSMSDLRTGAAGAGGGPITPPPPHPGQIPGQG